MNIFYLIGIFVGLLAGFAIVALICRVCMGRWTFGSKYDERQKIARGKAYRDGFWTLLAAGFIAVMLMQIDMLRDCSVMLMMIVGMTGLVVYIISCIMRDAYMGLNDNPKKWIAFMILIAIFNIGLGAYYRISGSEVTEGWPNIIVGIAVLIISVVYIIRQCVIRRTGESE